MAPRPAPSSSASAATAAELQSLLRELRRSRRKRNAGGGDGGDERDDARRLEGLRRIFGRLLAEGQFELGNGSNVVSDNGNGGGGAAADASEGGGDASQQWQAWLSTQHDTFIAHLAEGVADGKTSSLRTFCGAIASSPVPISGVDGGTGDMLSERLLQKLLEAAFKSRACLEAIGDGPPDNTEGKSNHKKEESSERLTTEESILSLLEAEFVRPHRDVQYFVCKGLKQISQELLGGLDRAKKRAAAAAKEKGDGAEKCKEDGDEQADGDEDDMVAAAERNVGMVAENMCRLLLTMDCVPTSAGDLEDAAGFLFPPPVLSEDDAIDEEEEEEGGEDDAEEDSEDDESSSSSEEEEESDEETSKGKKRPTSSKNQGNRNTKRQKKPRVIAWQRPYKHRHAHQEAWLAVLRLPGLPVRTQKRALQHLSSYVLTICPSPLRFAEYFTRSFQMGTGGRKADGTTAANSSSSSSSLVSILSLQGLFVLMLEHQLEYPQFYDSLYRLLHPRILYTKHRAQFLRLLSKSLLSNSMLPAYVAASFCKRLCRLALSGPPSGGLFALALVGNLLRKHGECACLVHRRGNPNDGGAIDDVFVEDADDLAESRALESSLWELAALERHYHPAISTMAGAVGTEDDKSTPMHDLEDFAAHTYKSLFETEKKRLGSGGGAGGKRKGRGGKVSVTFVEPEGLFAKDDVFGESFKRS